MTNEEVKLCKDCKWFKDAYGLALCTVGAPSIEVVSGIELHSSASFMRSGGWLEARISGVCGLEGRWWEAKRAPLKIVGQPKTVRGIADAILKERAK